MAQASKPPITCHVLNTVTGFPAAFMPVKLSLAKPAEQSTTLFSAVTNSDGRVLSWDAPQGSTSLQEVFDQVRSSGVETIVWQLTFDVGQYFKGEGFWEEVDIRFKTDLGGTTPREHWHVPLLLSPWSYTTYRGS